LDKNGDEREFGFKAKLDFVEGLKRAIEWYKKNHFKYRKEDSR
jgi:GDP-L-fucose synthase